MKYCVFETDWGYFALAGTEDELCFTQLPGPDAVAVESLLLGRLAATERKMAGRAGASRDLESLQLRSGVRLDSSYFKSVQEQIRAYFAGQKVIFDSEILLNFGSMSDFGRAVLFACRQVGFGQTVTYSTLARLAGSPGASRAVGGVMAANPMPLLVPCHRVLRSDGGLGGFSAAGGVAVKRRLLDHERRCAG